MKKSLGAKTILYPTPVWVIGSYDKEGKANVMTASWAGICSSDPPAVMVAIRNPRYTFDNIKRRGAFTVNIPSEKHVKEADYFGIKSGKLEDKFEISGLKPAGSVLVDAPIVEDFPMTAECKLLHTLEVGVHTLFIGEIMDVKCEEEVLNDSGMPDVGRLKAFSFDPASTKYYKIGEYLADGFSCGKNIKKG